MSAYQAGGDGGVGYYGADAADGASTTMTDAVSGSTSGSLTLTQVATGGAGGLSSGGGAAGR